MGSHSSRPQVTDRSFSSSSSPHFSSALCTSKSSSTACKATRAAEYNVNGGGGGSAHQHHHHLSAREREAEAATAKLTLAEREREQSSNYFSNDYKRQLTQRKAALRREREQRNSQPHSSRSQESGLSSQLSKEDISHLAESQVEVILSEDPLGVHPHRSTAPSVISDTSVRTVAHKPLLYHDESGESESAEQLVQQQQQQQQIQPPKSVTRRPTRRLRWSDDVVDADVRRRQAGTTTMVPFFAVGTSQADSCNNFSWSCDPCCDVGGGGCDSMCAC